MRAVNETAQRLPAGRKAEVASAVSELGQVTVTELADRFAVSVDTIRRDLDQLDAEGLVIRTRGGAMSLSAVPWHDTGLDDRSRLRPTEKDAIGQLAGTLVPDGAVLFINAGTTTLAAVRHLSRRRELIIATNNLRIPLEISPDCCRDLYVLGGQVRLSGAVAIGPVTFTNPLTGTEVDIRVDLALLGVGAVDAENGFSTSNLSEASMIAEMAARAKKVAVLADSTKFGKSLFAAIGGLSMADYLITNTAPDWLLAEALKAHNVEVLYPSDGEVS
jgi:DeoR family fructose operon transcriptional repressor